MESYDEFLKIVNASYAQTKDIRETMREAGVSFSEVWEMIQFCNYYSNDVSVLVIDRTTRVS